MTNWNAQILTDFQLWEARCHGEANRTYHACGLVILDFELTASLSEVRRLYDKPIMVTSWTRCRAHNTALEGAKRSYHMNGRAVDLRAFRGDSLRELKEVCASIFPYTKNYDYHVHCDVRGERP